jgi:hypothetical protein
MLIPGRNDRRFPCDEFHSRQILIVRKSNFGSMAPVMYLRRRTHSIGPASTAECPLISSGI